ncbi:hypothetical protein PSAC2689_60262 [Paraburkholderia sacchari]
MCVQRMSDPSYSYTITASPLRDARQELELTMRGILCQRHLLKDAPRICPATVRNVM